ncbi:OmpH family outer membrane protein [Thermocrinis minervae]|uniref:Periplasmic chaperone for outer membrane proteins Skp n=1 Tax=Thermocrinis minervae TaxID=381751 RepID=A0A1M6RR73_9AQUI|nr:OmpH family outer membrane protein [Thermocrinis minervae]SHK34969.1 periplasmic chaperone for outer membrane proteins Skp [Thermocrinis minervae]
MKRLLILLLVGSFAYAEQKFVCVDPNRIIAESKVVAQKQEELKKKAQDYQSQLQEVNKRLEELKNQIQSKGISQQAREQKIKEYQQTEAKGIELQQKAQAELMELKSRLESELLAQVRNIGSQIAKEKGYTGILDCGAFLYIQPELDITKEVINRLDQSR